MQRRGVRAIVLVILAASLAPARLGAQAPVPSLDVDHEPVACFATGQHPLVTACFRPLRELARGRVYFQVEGDGGWYFVEMRSDMPCWAGVLPKPTKALVGRHVLYYVEGLTRSLASARTDEHRALVVSSREECRGRLAPLAASGPAAVLPSVPPGFALGKSSLALVAAAGAAAIAGMSAVVSGGPSPSPAPQPASTPQPPRLPQPEPSATPDPGAAPDPNPTPTPTPAPAPAPTPTPAPVPAELFPLAVSRSGTGAGRVTSEPGGIDCGSSCSASYPSGTRVTLLAQAEAGSTFEGWGGSCSGGDACVVTMDAARSVSARFDLRSFSLRVNKTPLLDLGTVTSSPPGIDCGLLCFSAAATFQAGTVVTLRAEPLPTARFRGWGGACSGTGPCVVTMDADTLVTAEFGLLGPLATVLPPAAVAPGGSALLRVTLDVPGGQADIVVDGRPVHLAPRGESLLELAGIAPLVEGRLREAIGPGTWRFEILAREGPASELLPLTGETLWLTTRAVVYRLQGSRGETVAFRLVPPRGAAP